MPTTTRQARVDLLDDGNGLVVHHASGGHGPDRLVEIGSVTKTVTSTALDRLAAEGSVDPDAPLETYLPVPAGTGITPALLAAHRSGLPRLPPGVLPFSRQPYRRFDDQALESLLGRLDDVQTAPPGGEPVYSNLGYAVLGEVLARAGGDSWYSVVRRTVLDPLELHEVVREPAEHPDAAAVLGRAGRWGRPRQPWQMAAMAPAGGLWATPRAVARWVRAAVLEQSLGPVTAAWQVAGRGIWHNGATRDAAVIAVGLPGPGRVVVVHTLGAGPAVTDELGIELATTGSEPSPVEDR